MKKNILSEVTRVREIMGLELVMEQDTKHEVGDKVDGQIFKGYVTKPVAETFNELGMYTVNSDDPSKFLDRFVKGIVAKITGDPLMKKSLDDGTLQLAKANIRSGASNWYGTPLKPEVDNKYGWEGNPNMNYYTNPQWFPKGYEALSGPETQDWIDNKDLALRRSTKFLAALKEALLANDPPIKIFPAIEETVTSTIVDTGGLTDEKCRDDANCEEHHPNPGQFVDADLAFAYNEVEEKWEDFEKCLGGMEITVAYIVPVAKYKKRWYNSGGQFWRQDSPRDIENSIEHSKSLQKSKGLSQESSKQHCCNSARFGLWLNDERIGGKGKAGIINLNNGKGNKKHCGGRAKTLTVSSEVAKAIAAKSPDKKLRLSIKGLQSMTHSEVPLVKVVNGMGETIFNGEPGLGGGGGGQDGWFDDRRDIFKPFSPCETIES